MIRRPPRSPHCPDTTLFRSPVPRADAARILRALGFGAADADDGLDVTVPYWRRGDVEREADLIEEVARIWGLEDRKSTRLNSSHANISYAAFCLKKKLHSLH